MGNNNGNSINNNKVLLQKLGSSGTTGVAKTHKYTITEDLERKSKALSVHANKYW